MDFNFQVVITESCNLGCTYCYMANVKNIMTKEMFNKHYEMLPLMMDRYNMSSYNLALFGGEPLTNFDLIQYILEKIQDDPRCKFKVIMTNGILLTDEKIKTFLEQHRVGTSISFDGLWNKTQRPFVSGESSFEHYVKHKEFYNKGSCKVMVAPDSLDTLVENFQWFVEDFGIPNPDFTIVRDDIWSKENIKKFKIESIKLKNKIIEYNEKGIPAMAGFYLLYILDTIFGKIYGKRSFSCFAGNSGAAFMPDGNIYACARFGSAQKLPIANSITKTFKTIEKSGVENPKVFDPNTYKKCQSCLLQRFCNGGCSYSELKYDDTTNEYYSEPLDSICEILHILYEDAYDLMDRLKTNPTFKQTIQNAIKNAG